MKYLAIVLICVCIPTICLYFVRKINQNKTSFLHYILFFFFANGLSLLIFCIQPERGVSHFLGHFVEVTFKFWIQYACLLLFSSLIVVCTLGCVDSYSKIDITKKTRRRSILGCIYFLLGCFFMQALPWACSRFPMQEPEIIWITITSPLKGADPSGIIALVLFVIIPAIVLQVVCILALKFFFYKDKKELLFHYKFFSIKKDIQFSKFFCVLTFLFFAYVMVHVAIEIKITRYINFITRERRDPIDSLFYKENYIVPDTVQITFPEKKRNLVYIFLESMESSYQAVENGGYFSKNYIPNLTALAQENINFSHINGVGGGIDAAGTGWTIAALLSKMGGLPYNLPTVGFNPDNMIHFLPGAITLTDILAEAGYNQRFIFGSEKGFASRDTLLETHGNVEIHDIDWYKKNKMLSEDYDVFWGFEDQKLYEYAKKELAELSSSDQPFMFGMLTVDTHMPDGYICPLCPTDKINEDDQILSVVECADKQLGEFVSWIKEQSWYENTTVVIVGDHLFMTSKEKDIFNEQKDTFDEQAETKERRLENSLGESVLSSSPRNSSRRWINIFMNSAVQPTEDVMKNRTFSSFDMFPTVLESIGAEIEGRKLGFGCSLFSGEPTLYEKYDKTYVNTEILRRTIQYNEIQ